MSTIHNVFLSNNEYKKFKRSNLLDFNNIPPLNLDPEVIHKFRYIQEGGGA